MARFRGTVKGGRGEGSRLGHKNSGLTLRGNTWNGRITVYLFANKDDEDWASVGHEDAKGVFTSLYHGPVAKYVNPRKVELIKLWDNNDPTE